MRAWKRRKVFPGLFFFALALASRASAQSILDARQPFVSNLIQVLENIPGTFGDERSRVSTALDGMEAGLHRWDAAIGAQSGGRGAVLLDRGRAAEAIAEFTRAGDRRLRALAYESQGNAEAAASDFIAAWLSEPQDPAAAYLFLFHRPAGVASDQVGPATQVLTTFANRQASRGAGPSAPFVQLSLLDEAQSAEPVFLPARYAAAARQLRDRQYDGMLKALRDGWAADPLATDPAAAAPSFVAAAAAFRDGRFPDAIAGFEAAVRAFPSSSEAKRLLGTAYWLNDETAKSITELRAAIALDARDERSRITLADVLTGDRQFVDAERLLRETTAALPESGQGHWRLGRLLDTLHREAESRREREAAVALAPVAGASRALGAIATAYVGEGNLDKAAEVARARVTANRNDAAAHEHLGQIRLQQGRETDALVELTVATLLDPSRAEAEAAIAQIHLGAGRYADATDAARRALARNPKNREARFALARALLQSGADAEGRSELAAAQQLQAEELEAVRQSFAANLIRIEAAQREQEEKWDEAARLRRQVAAQPSATPSDFALLGEALSKAGRHDEAIDVLREALRRDEQPEAYQALIRELTVAGRNAEAAATRTTYQRVKRERFLR